MTVLVAVFLYAYTHICIILNKIKILKKQINNFKKHNIYKILGKKTFDEIKKNENS